MSVTYCFTHDRYVDTDFDLICPDCEQEQADDEGIAASGQSPAGLACAICGKAVTEPAYRDVCCACETRGLDVAMGELLRDGDRYHDAYAEVILRGVMI